MPSRHFVPKYRLHKPSGRALVQIAGKRFYLGQHGSEESLAEYRRFVAELLSSGHAPARPSEHDSANDGLTVAELVLAYLRWAEGYYLPREGRRQTEADAVRSALAPAVRLYGDIEAANFGPVALKTVRQALVDSGLCRNEVNKRVGRITRAFKWAVENELVPPSVLHGLKSVGGLRLGRTGARESKPVRPVANAFIEAVRPHVLPEVWAMIELQQLTGMRPGEVTIMRTGDLDTSGDVWSYTPARHKTDYHGHRRTIYLGPKAQAVLKPWLRTDLLGFVFSPRTAMDRRNDERKAARKTPMTPSHRARKRKRRPKRVPGERWTTSAYSRAIRNACRRAAIAQLVAQGATLKDARSTVAKDGFPSWHPHQLRHNAATRLRKEFGLDTARAILGHRTPAVTELYAELDQAKAVEVMGRVG